MKRLLYGAALCFLLVGRAFSQTPEENIRTLLHVSGAASLGSQMLDLVIAQMRTVVPQVPPEFWDKFRDKADIQGLIDLLVPIYAQYYTDAEVRELIEFYSTPLGRRVVEVTAAMTAESYAAGQKWGQRLAEQIMEELRRAGYTIPGAGG